jgi:hypothetical protein
MNETVYYDNAVTVVSRDSFKRHSHVKVREERGWGRVYIIYNLKTNLSNTFVGSLCMSY